MPHGHPHLDPRHSGDARLVGAITVNVLLTAAFVHNLSDAFAS